MKESSAGVSNTMTYVAALQVTIWNNDCSHKIRSCIEYFIQTDLY